MQADAIVQVRQHGRAARSGLHLRFQMIQAKNFLPALKIKPQNRVNRFGCVAPVLLNLVVNSIKPNIAGNGCPGAAAARA